MAFLPVPDFSTPQFDVLKINLQSLKNEKNPAKIINAVARKIGEGLGKKITGIDNYPDR